MKKSKSRWKLNLNDALNHITAIVREFSILLYILIKPLTIVTIIPATALIIFAQTQTGMVRLILDIITAFLFSVAGGLITNYVIQYTGNTFLIKKSVSAIRNLQLIKFKIKNASERISELRKENNNRDFEEVDNLIANINKDILNSISDWGDVNPNSEKVTDFYELVSEKEAEIKKVKFEKEALEKQKASLAQDKQSEKEKLERAISQKNDEIWNLHNKLSKLNQNNIGIVSGSILSNPTMSGSLTFNPSQTCAICGTTVIGHHDHSGGIY